MNKLALAERDTSNTLTEVQVIDVLIDLAERTLV